MPAAHADENPILALLSLSDLAREGIANRGSYRFADHIYRRQASGRWVVGRGLDAAFLRLPAAAAFRRRYLRARDAMTAVVRARAGHGATRILTVPCGIPRDAVEMARLLDAERPGLLDAVEYVGMDIDPAALDVAAAFARGTPLQAATFHRGDALDRAQYPAGRFHVVSSTGLTEFLSDADAAVLFANVHAALEPGGTFFTSATASDPVSALLLKVIDLPTEYRPQPRLASILERLPWQRVSYVVDRTGLQTFATAIK